MIEGAGRIRVRIRDPYIYFILKRSYLYIGETQSAPVIRWGEHLQRMGTFTQKLKLRDAEALETDDPVDFWGFRCAKVSTEICDKPLRKKIAQYVEHQVHVLIRGESALVKLEVISDTSRTARLRCPVSWGDKMAKEIVDCFIRARDLKG